MASLNSITYRQFNESDSIEALTDLLHHGYADHAAAGRKFFASHQTPEDTKKRINKGECWVAVSGSDIIGTISFNYPMNPAYGYPAVSNAGTFYQFTISPEYRGKGLGNALLELAEQKLEALGADEIIFDTASTATELIDWYQRRGYLPCGTYQWRVTNYLSIVMKKPIQRAKD